MMNIIGRVQALGIYKIYYFSIIIYIVPFICLSILSLIWMLGIAVNNELTLFIYLLIVLMLAPFGAMGLLLSIIGLVRSLLWGGPLNIGLGLVATAVGWGLLLLYANTIFSGDELIL